MPMDVYRKNVIGFLQNSIGSRFFAAISFLFYAFSSFFYFKLNQLNAIDLNLKSYYNSTFWVQDAILYILELFLYLLINSFIVSKITKSSYRRVFILLSALYSLLTISFIFGSTVSYFVFLITLLFINIFAVWYFWRQNGLPSLLVSTASDCALIALFIVLAFLPLFDPQISLFEIQSIFMEIWSLSNYMSTVHSALSLNQSPLWSPNLVFGGVPLPAAPQYHYGFLYFLYRILPLTIANPDFLIYIHKMQYGLQLIAGTIGYYLLACLTLGVSRWASLSTAAMMLLNLGTLNRVSAEAQWGIFPLLVLPYVTMLIIRSVRRNMIFDYALIGVAFGILSRFHYSDPELIFGMLYFILLFVILLWIANSQDISLIKGATALVAIAVPALAGLFPAIAFSAIASADGTVISSPLGSIGESHYEHPSNHLFTVLNDLSGLFTIPAATEQMKKGLTIYILGIGRLGGVALVSFLAIFAALDAAGKGASGRSVAHSFGHRIAQASVLSMIVFPILILAPWSYVGYLVGLPAFPPHSLGRLTICLLMPFAILFAFGFDGLIGSIERGSWRAPLVVAAVYVTVVFSVAVSVGFAGTANSDFAGAALVFPILMALYAVRRARFAAPALLLFAIVGFSYNAIDLKSRDMLTSQAYVEQLMRATPVHFRTAGVRLVDRLSRNDLPQSISPSFTVGRRLTIISKLLPERRATAALFALPHDLIRELKALRAIQHRVGDEAALQATSAVINDLAPLVSYAGDPESLLERLRPLTAAVDAVRFRSPGARNFFSSMIPEDILAKEGIRIGLNNANPVNYGEQTYNSFRLFYPDVSDTYYYPVAVDIYRWVSWLDYYFRDISFIMNKHMGPANFFPMANAHQAHLAGIQYVLSAAASEQSPFIKEWPLIREFGGYQLRKNLNVQQEGLLVNAFTPITPIIYSKARHNDMNRVAAGVQLLNTQALPLAPLVELTADQTKQLRGALADGVDIRREPADAVVVKRRGNFVFVETSTVKVAGLLQVLSAYHRDWRAFADREEIPVYRSNLAFQSVVVDGKSSVLWMEFRPPAYYWGMLAYLMLLNIIFGSRLLSAGNQHEPARPSPAESALSRQV